MPQPWLWQRFSDWRFGLGGEGVRVRIWTHNGKLEFRAVGKTADVSAAKLAELVVSMAPSGTGAVTCMKQGSKQWKVHVEGFEDFDNLDQRIRNVLINQ